MSEGKTPTIVKKVGSSRFMSVGDHNIPLSVTDGDGKEYKALLKPFVPTEVPEPIAKLIRQKFPEGFNRMNMVPDVEANEKNPHKPGAPPIMKQERSPHQYTIIEK